MPENPPYPVRVHASQDPSLYRGAVPGQVAVGTCEVALAGAAFAVLLRIG